MIIVRYLIRETIKSQLAIFFVLFLIFLSQRFISVLAEASNGDIPARLIMTVVGLNMPAMGLLMLPLSLYIGILLTFGRLYAESEITVMNATGIGNKFLIQAALYLALITSGVAAFNSLYFSPWAQDKEAQIMEDLAADTSVELLQKGQFQRTPDGTAVVFIDELKDKRLTNVFIAQTVGEGSIRPSVAFADSGLAQELSDGRQILTLFNGTRWEGIPTQLDYMRTDFDEYDALIGQREVKPKGRDFEALPTIQLWNNPDKRAKAELHWRLSLIICIPLLTLVVIPLSAVNPRQGRFAKMGPAILFYLAYFMSISAAKSAIEDGKISEVIGMWPMNIGLLVVGLALNSMDSLPVRRWKDKIRQKRAA
ncbi:LPS export ABC transporter permease LptF [Vibrio breoganii]|uniref:LPS export ABC transporter permease LptF n=1 Tax=Vibrio breoganii TaxID=553239 RepID=UPI0002DE7B87|nr:LPS export ABC transporter permease LptF [Vibrio breoganii]OED98374.1 LPS export ABC transporter permease LptF [Vibrio breoganii ZF-29]OEF86104.1 LPS export ABC transporter permease LptF [Vibrio breoganii 1C10]PMG83555.1 LPS export ABC transporter permease LptF [Vibrio breoganii]PMH00008.1 LPS export ABC transporter permease LptF [Vibrio breoganii]PMK26995.1 LPS export ABC transporter permease LptF [Vibrio breoganii]